MGEEEIKNSFERCCRLCAEEQEVTIMIFSEEAKAMLLHSKLNKYLMIEVDQEDKLPKNICISCCTTLQTVCNFIDSARSAQKVLLNRCSMVEQFVAEQKLTVKSEPKSDHEDNCDDENKSTEMEISVDPMIVLQNSERIMSPSIDNDSNLSNESNLAYITQDVTHMHSVDQENVTIKLIRKDVKLDQTLKPFPCLSCDRSFLTEIALKNHSWIHCGGDGKYFRCNSCEAGFDFKHELIAHIKEHKLSGLCQICGRCFRTEKNLIAHMAAHATVGKSYNCKICNRSYNTMSNLKTHSVTHSTERPYQCHLCKKSFKRNQDLKFHINLHSGAKPYKCPFCEKSFASSGNCYSHRNRMHPGRRVESKIRRYGSVSRENLPLSYKPIAPKPHLASVKGMIKYQCTMCDHSFMKRDNFTYHMYQHTGEKPFHCTLCPEKFVTRRGLLIHHNKEHPGKDRPLALISKNILLK